LFEKLEVCAKLVVVRIKGAFTLGVKDSKVESLNTMLPI
jgi:hypothetical protein